jgi:DNA-binding NarL/FixJ family response regulator
MKNQEKVKILIVDDHVLFRRGLKELLSDNKDFIVVGELDDGMEVHSFVSNHLVDIILMDIQMPGQDGIKTVRKLRKKRIKTGIIILTVSSQDSDLISAIKAGADGYLLKSSEFRELENAIYCVARGERAISNHLVSKLFNAVKSKNDFPAHKILSKREQDVLILLSKGLSYEKIADAMFISENTVKTHTKHLYEKMSASNKNEAVEKGILWGLLEEN